MIDPNVNTRQATSTCSDDYDIECIPIAWFMLFKRVAEILMKTTDTGKSKISNAQVNLT